MENGRNEMQSPESISPKEIVTKNATRVQLSSNQYILEQVYWGSSIPSLVY